MHAFTISIFGTFIISISAFILTPSGAVALAKIQQQQTKAIANLLKARAARNIAKAKYGQYLNKRSQWARSSDDFDEADPIPDEHVGQHRMVPEEGRPEGPCAFGRCANPSGGTKQDPRAGHLDDQQEESQRALENMWSMNQMNNKDSDGILRDVVGERQQKTADPTHVSHKITHYHQSTHGINHEYGQPPVNVHVIQNQASVVPSYPSYNSGGGFSNGGYSGGHGQINHFGHGSELVHPVGENSQIAQISGHGNSLVQNQNVDSGFRRGPVSFIGGRMGEDTADVRPTIVTESTTENVATENMMDKNTARVQGPTESTATSQIADKRIKTNNTDEMTTGTPVQFDGGYVLPTDPPMLPLKGVNDSTWSPIRKAYYVPKGRTITVIPMLHVPLNYTGVVDPLELVIMDHRKNGTKVLNPDFNPPSTQRKKIVETKRTSEESSEEINSANTVVSDDPAAIYKILADEAVKSDINDASQKNDDGTMEIKKIYFDGKVRVDVLPTLYLPKNYQEHRTTTEKNSQAIVQEFVTPPPPIEHLKKNPDDSKTDNFETTNHKAREDEFLKEVTRNASKIPYVRPVAPLNSSYTGPKGPTQKIQFYPPGGYLELNPLRYIPKGFNGSLDNRFIYLDKSGNFNQTGFDNTGDFKRSEGQNGDRVVQQGGHQVVHDETPGPHDEIRNQPIVQEFVTPPPPIEHLEKNPDDSRNVNFENTNQKAREDEFLKEVTRNASKIPFVRPVAPLNSSYTGPKGPTQKIQFYPPGGYLELNPMRFIPKGFNGSIDPSFIYLDKSGNFNQTGFDNTGDFRRSEGQNGDRVVQHGGHQVVHDETPGPHDDRNQPIVPEFVTPPPPTEHIEKIPVDSRSGHFENTNHMARDEEWSELTKEVIRNASKIPYRRPVAPLNSSYTGPKGPTQKIQVYPPGSHLEVNPMLYIPKGFNEPIDPTNFYFDKKDPLNQTDFVNTDGFRRSKAQNETEVAHHGDHQAVHDKKPGPHNEGEIPKHLPLKTEQTTSVPQKQRSYYQSPQFGNHQPNYYQESAYKPEPSPQYEQPQEEYEDFDLGKKFRQYFQPFGQKYQENGYSNEPTYNNNGYNYQGKEYSQSYTRNSRENTQNSDIVGLSNVQNFKDDIGMYDGDVSKKTEDYYDHERLGAYLDKNLLNSEPIVSENFSTLPLEQQQGLLKKYLEEEAKDAIDLIQSTKDSITKKDDKLGEPLEKIEKSHQVSSPNLFNVRSNNRKKWEDDNYYRNAEKSRDLDRVMLQQKNMIDSLKRDADHNQDLMLISYLGESVLKDIERQRKVSNRTKRQQPSMPLSLGQIINDPTMSLDLEKTIENFGAVARHTLEDPGAPIFHLRSMMGNVKDSAMSAMKIVPNNVLVPSRFEIRNIGDDSDQLGAINRQLLDSKTDTKENFEPKGQREASGGGDLLGVDDTFQKIGQIIRESVNSGKNSIVHAGNVANDAKHMITTAQHSTPRLILPKSPTLGLANNPLKTMFLTPKLIDLTQDKVGRPQENFLGMGHILDAVGVSNPNPSQVGLEKITIEPRKLSGDNATDEVQSPQPINAKDWLESIRVERVEDGNVDDETLGRTLSDLQSAKESVGAASMQDFFDTMRQEFRTILRSELGETDHVKERRKQKKMQETQDSNTKEEKTMMEVPTNEALVGDGLYLPNELMHPFMGQATKTQLKEYLEDNGDNQFLEDQKDLLGAARPTSGRGINDDLSHILGAMNPLMFERYFNDTMRNSKGSFRNPEEMFREERMDKPIAQKEITNQNETVTSSRTFIPKIQGQMMKPFLGTISKKHEKEFLDKYNPKPEGYGGQYYPQDNQYVDIPENEYIETY